MAQKQKKQFGPSKQQKKKLLKKKVIKKEFDISGIRSAKISAVQIEGLVLLKIIKHCGEYLPQRQAVEGKLLGLPTDENTVEITNSFPIPTQFTESSNDISGDNDKRAKINKRATKYAQDMIRLMHRIREDNLVVGFYRSALNGSFLTSQTIEAQYQHQLHSAQSVCIIYDPTASIRGRLLIRAFRLTDQFMKFYSKQDFGCTSISKLNLSSINIFEELDIKIHNSHLVHAFLYEIAQLPSDKSLTLSHLFIYIYPCTHLN